MLAISKHLTLLGSLPRFLGLEATGWYALGQMLVGVAAVGGSVWAVRLYKASRRLEAARWLDGIFRDFYVNESFADVRWLLARRTFLSEVAPILEHSIEDPSDILNEDAARTLHSIDRLLNFFEHLLYMESEGNLPVKAREAFFGYWFELMSSEPYKPLRRYVESYGYEYLAEFLLKSRRASSELSSKASQAAPPVASDGASPPGQDEDHDRDAETRSGTGEQI